MYKIYDYYASNGGFINGAIFIVAVSVLYIGLGKLIQFRSIAKKTSFCEVDGTVPRCYCILHELFFCKEQHSPSFYKNAFREKLLQVVPRLESGLDTMATLIQTAPYLGLFGTVAGMIETFSLITTYGTANPVILTEGITVSLLTTQAGLLVAFPCMLFHNFLANKKDALLYDILAQGEAMISRAGKENGDYDV
ncbi:MAG: MotA/TolQ/ExbB proton channel family protein [Chitinispirillaceae bacterium]|nr:MotA/TolQ/ExbB proton channel family protein [Chitinispirillaceae bacterium]